jgi:hypothetical protein
VLPVPETGNNTDLQLTSFNCLRASWFFSLPTHNAFLGCRCQRDHRPTQESSHSTSGLLMVPPLCTDLCFRNFHSRLWSLLHHSFLSYWLLAVVGLTIVFNSLLCMFYFSSLDQKLLKDKDYIFDLFGFQPIMHSILFVYNRLLAHLCWLTFIFSAQLPT